MEREVSLIPLSRICAEIFKPAFTLQHALLASLAEVQIGGTAWLGSIKTEASEECVVDEVSSNSLLNARVRQTLRCTSSVMSRLALDALFQKVKYHKLVSRY